MASIPRRRFLQSTLLGGAAALLPRSAARAAGEGGSGAPGLRIATFRADLTPPIGHPLCGGWISPATEVLDPLEAVGFVILGAGAPQVVCAIDWTGVLNAEHLAWREAIARAVGTTPDRVALQCVHQHDAPFVCFRADELLRPYGFAVVDRAFVAAMRDRLAAAAGASLATARPLTHVARGAAPVEQIAGNRRVLLDAAGKVVRMRGSSCRDAELIALPEGLIDPQLRTVAFYSGETRVAACHYYACHPMSHYGKGRVSSDYVGLARRRRQQEDPGCLHLYFTGAAGDISAGKYNDGSIEARVRLTERLHRAMLRSEESLQPRPLQRVRWSTRDILPPPDPSFTPAQLRAQLADPSKTQVLRSIAAMRLSWRDRVDSGLPICVSALHLDDISLLHLPAESFVEYQLLAQGVSPDRFVATAAYGDGGPWYLPTKPEYPKGGYEVSVAFCDPVVDDILTVAIRGVLAGAA
jgi:hypothetical protein